LDDRNTGSRWWYALLVLPFIGLLWVPIYAKDDPEVFGFPFFYWYQFLWVPLSVALTYFVYRRTRTRGEAPTRRPPLEDEPGRPTPGATE
jgi:cbb3-type cytochrome oxidase subunit 3